MTAEQLARAIAAALEEKGGVDIKVIDLRGASPITDYCVIATGTSAPNLKALATQTANTVRQSGSQIHRTNGDSESGWLVIDCFDVIVHVFTAEARAYYAIERLWDKARQLADAPLDNSPASPGEPTPAATEPESPTARADLLINLQISGVALSETDRKLITEGVPVNQWPEELRTKARPFLRTIR
ncbi:MAG: ribosome silencing factor [Kiritimatiellia bacterium]